MLLHSSKKEKIKIVFKVRKMAAGSKKGGKHANPRRRETLTL